MHTVVHVTHEAVQKIGGIGAVLHGLITSKTYRGAVERDILLGPLFWPEGPAEGRLHGGTVLYSGLDGIRNTPYASDFAHIEHEYGVKLIYGKKTFHDPLTGVTFEPEVVLVDVRHYNPDKMGVLKFVLFKDYGIESGRYEHVWDYEQYCRIAEPGLAAVRAIGGCSNGEKPLILSHEYMGMPTALCARSRYPGQFKTIFYAHEVATIRRIVEDHPGHDTMFYNVLNKAVGQGKYVEDVFGSQKDFYKHPLVEASRHCDTIFAVGDYVVKELRFLGKEFKEARIDLAYNGVPARALTLEEKMRSRRKLQQYCVNLLGYSPDFVFTHVTRMVPSKGLWRDVKMAEQLEKHLAKEGKTAVHFVLSTETVGRAPHEIENMEQGYKWPVAHREGHPDLTGGEAAFYVGVQEWNARARCCKIVYLNQFGFDRTTCGNRMPAEMDFLDIRKGSDAEFGQSIYEPFGIAQVEPISFGGICAYTELCGCAGFVRRAWAAANRGKEGTGEGCPNAIELDYTQLPETMAGMTVGELMKMDGRVRDEIESSVAGAAAAELYKRLPRTEGDFEKLIATGAALGREMNWDAVARNYVLPGMERAMGNQGKN
ncbi:MAG TPA: hypothetical protein VHQ47_08445 [Phycisphaerae bacterium]|nr:hypothetical protein [Phycisphaerae bacterium]